MRLPAPILASAFAKTHSAQLLGHDQAIHGINEIHNVEVGDLTFVDHPKYYKATLSSQASVILIDREPEGELPAGKTLLVLAQPFEAYNALIKEHRPAYVLNETMARSANVHPSAIIEPGAIIGPKVVIGAHSVIGANAVIYGPTRIGEHCRIGSNTIIGDQAFYFRGIGDKGRQRWATGGDVLIEDYVEIGPLCNVARGVSATTRIGRGTKIDAQVMIGHDVSIGENCLFASQVGIAGNVTIEDKVILYGQVGIIQNVTIGAGAILLGKAGVSKDLAPGGVYSGRPAQANRAHMKEAAALRRLART